MIVCARLRAGRHGLGRRAVTPAAEESVSTDAQHRPDGAGGEAKQRDPARPQADAPEPRANRRRGPAQARCRRPCAAALVFVAAGAVLMLEILAVRLLAPYVGLTLETTTSIIGAALAGIAVGAAVGGYFADRTDTRLLIVGLLRRRRPAHPAHGPDRALARPRRPRRAATLAALGITVIALVPAAAVLSAVSPAVAHLQLHDLHGQRHDRRPALGLGHRGRADRHLRHRLRARPADAGQHRRAR